MATAASEHPGHSTGASLPPAKLRKTLHDLGFILLIPGGMALVSAIVAAAFGEWYCLPGLAATVVVSAGFGGALFWPNRRHGWDRAPSKATMAIGWLLAAAVAGLPFLVTAWSPGSWTAAPLPATTLAFRDPINALFEAVSGITSTGLTVARDPSVLPHTLQWWRSFLEWVGGIGILFLGLFIIHPNEEEYTHLEAALDQEMNTRELSEETGSVVAAVWGIYALFTVLSVLAFFLAGMPAWEAVNHGMAGISTGGFTITPDSFASYDTTLQALGVLVTVMGALSFALHYALIARRDLGVLRRDTQALSLLLLLVLGSALVWGIQQRTTPGTSAMAAVFQWASALGTCGFSTTAVAGWQPATLLLLTGAMFIGGASGSTAGGIKQRRFVLIAKGLLWRLRLQKERPARPVVIDGHRLDEDQAYRSIHNASLLLTAFLSTLVIGTFLLLLFDGGGHGLSDVLFEAASALGTTGLSTGVTSPALSAGGRLVLVALMWVGRLEVLAVLVLLTRPELLYRRRPHGGPRQGPSAGPEDDTAAGGEAGQDR